MREARPIGNTSLSQDFSGDRAPGQHGSRSDSPPARAPGGPLWWAVRRGEGITEGAAINTKRRFSIDLWYRSRGEHSCPGVGDQRCMVQPSAQSLGGGTTR
jgi:hypothetical protein